MRRVQLVAAAFLVLHLVVASGTPASAWGVDSLAYQSGMRRWGFAIAAALLFVPAARRSLLGLLRFRGLDVGGSSFTALRLAVVLAIVGGIVFASLSSPVQLLGDGMLHSGFLMLLRARGVGYSDVVWPNNNAPLCYWVWQTVHHLGKSWWSSPELTMRLVSIGSGIAYLGLAVPVSRRLADSATARALILGFLATAGYAQLFAGYAEIYGLLLPALLVYVLAALRDFRSSRFPWVAASVLGVLVALHLMTVTLLPSLVMLAVVRAKGAELRPRGGTRAAVAGSAVAAVGWTAAVALALFFALDFDLIGYLRTRRASHLLPLFSDPTFLQNYRMFSYRHIVDLANQYLLVAPAAVMGAFLLRGSGGADPRRSFLAVAAVPPVLFTIVANPEVGPFRDWDVFSFAAPLVLLWVAASLARSCRSEHELGHVAVLIVGAAGLHSLSWIAVNADSAAAEARFSRLLASCPVSAHAVAYGWETLATHYEVTGRPQEALSSLERAIRANPDHPRYWRRAGEIHFEAGQDDRARRYLARALELDPEQVDACLPLGILAFRANDVAGATALFERVVAKQPGNAAAWYNLGLCHSRRGKAEEALRCYRAAVEAKPDFADARVRLAELLHGSTRSSAPRVRAR